MSGVGSAVFVAKLLQSSEQRLSRQRQEKVMSSILPLRDKILTNS